MPDIKKLCPYCKEEFQSWGLFRHVLSKHEEAFVYHKNKFEDNLKLLHHKTGKSTLPSFYLTTNKLISVCFGCSSSFSKDKLAFGHWDKCQSCKENHFEKLKVLQEKYPLEKTTDLSGCVVATTVQQVVINNYNATTDPAVLAVLYAMKKELNDQWKQINTSIKKHEKLMVFLKKKYPDDVEEIEEVYDEVSDDSSVDEPVSSKIKAAGINKKYPDFKIDESKAKKAYEETIHLKV
jgi:hypothetical protein